MVFKLSSQLVLIAATLFMFSSASEIKYCLESKSDVSRCVLPPFKLSPKPMCKVRVCVPTYIEGEKCGKDPLTRATYVCKVEKKERKVWQCIPGMSEMASERSPLGTCKCEIVQKEFMEFTKWEPIDESECKRSESS